MNRQPTYIYKTKNGGGNISNGGGRAFVAKQETKEGDVNTNCQKQGKMVDGEIRRQVYAHLRQGNRRDSGDYVEGNNHAKHYAGAWLDPFFAGHADKLFAAHDTGSAQHQGQEYAAKHDADDGTAK